MAGVNDYGNFDSFNFEEFELEFLTDYDDEILTTIESSEMLASTVQQKQELQKISMELKKDEDGERRDRFRSISTCDVQEYEEAHQSRQTKKNTKWAIKIFQDWHTSRHNDGLDFENVTEQTLGERLRQFYCEVAPQQSLARNERLGGEVAQVYHKNSVKSIRSGINRHLADLKRNIDIVNGVSFKCANRTLDGFMKAQTKLGKSRPTMHKPVIEKSDLKLISAYFTGAVSCPIILRQCVWFTLGLHFVSRGQEFHHQLKASSFKFETDTNGLEYVTLTHETQQKNFQGGLSKEESPADKRMYGTNTDSCPVKMLRLLLSKTDSSAEMLFNSCSKEALREPSKNEIWFINKPLAKRTYGNFMADISKSSKTGKVYTAHCVRATAIQALNDQGFDTRHIMFMSGHRNESSLKSYCRAPSTCQKKELSTALNSLTDDGNITPPTSTSVVPRHDAPRLTTNSMQSIVNPVFNSGSFNACSFNITFSNH